jgi:hypothetical protein
MAYCFWLKNRILSYERIYKRIQDIISIIGGVFEFIYFSSIVMNYLYSKFIVLLDSEILLFSSIEEYEKRKKENRYNNNLNLINNLVKNNNKQIELNSSKSLTSIRLNVKRKKLKDKSLKNQKIMKKNNNKELAFINENNSKDIIIIQNNNNLEISSDYRNRKTMENSKKEKSIENKNKLVELNIRKLDFNFLDYINYKLKCGKNKIDLKIYHDFRTKLISEESIIKNYLNIYFLLKINQVSFFDYKNKLKLEDLINDLRIKII